jgi:hypothetical protein
VPYLTATRFPRTNTQDKYEVTVPGGLSMSESKGYEGWQALGRGETVDASTETSSRNRG